MKIDIFAIITTFFPSNSNLINIKKICNQFNNILIFDNSCNEAVKKNLTSFFSGLKHVKIIYSVENRGIGFAFNQAIKHIGFTYSWFILFDQDSIVSGSIKKYLNHYLIKNKFDILSLSYSEKKLSNKKTFGLNLYEIYPVKRSIISGMVISSKVLKKIKFRENFYLDMVDHDFCYRAINSGFVMAKTRKDFIFHKVGDTQINKFIFLKKKRLNHNIFRYYLMSRNKILFDKYNHGYLKSKTIYKLFKEVFLIIFFDTKKLKKLHAHLFGIKDGIFPKQFKLNQIRMMFSE